MAEGASMKFGIFYEHQLPRPWGPKSEYQLLQDSLSQIELADQLGYDYAWEVEHHFLEEYSHSSAPEVFLGAASQRTKRIRLGHGVVQLTTNQPHRVAEPVATLDLLSAARAWVHKYYNNLLNNPKKLTDYPSNPNVAMVSGFMCAPTDEEAEAKAAGWTFFIFSLSYYGRKGVDAPGTSDLWKEYQSWKGGPEEKKALESGLIGSPETLPKKLRQFPHSPVHQGILLNHAGKTNHPDICPSLP